MKKVIYILTLSFLFSSTSLTFAEEDSTASSSSSTSSETLPVDPEL